MTEERDFVDDVLDRALALRGRAEPRPGLEGRVLATLRAGPHLPWWKSLFALRPARAGLAAVALAGVAAVLVLGQGDRTGQVAAPVVAVLPSPTIPQGNERPPISSEARAPAGVPMPGARPATLARIAPAARTTRRSSFPHESPLSDQERLLLRYVSEAPHEELESRAGFLDAPALLPALPEPATEP